MGGGVRARSGDVRLLAQINADAGVDAHRVVHAVEAESEDAIRARFARDPWSETHLLVDTIDPWTIRLDAGRARQVG